MEPIKETETGKLFTQEEAAGKLGMSRDRVLGLVNGGYLDARRLPGIIESRDWLIPQKTIDAYLEANPREVKIPASRASAEKKGDLLTVKEAADKLGLTCESVVLLARHGSLGPRLVPAAAPGGWLIPWKAIDDYLNHAKGQKTENPRFASQGSG